MIDCNIHDIAGNVRLIALTGDVVCVVSFVFVIYTTLFTHGSLIYIRSNTSCCR
jgi:hypothetical protein